MPLAALHNDHDAALMIALMHDSLLTAIELEAKCDAIGECLDARKCETCNHVKQAHTPACTTCLCRGYVWTK